MASRSGSEEGKRKGEKGMRLALDHADEVHDDWSGMAFIYLSQFVLLHEGTFTTPEVRKFAHDRGLPHPPSNRAWGGVMNKAMRSGLIKNVGFVPSVDPNQHYTPNRLWQAT